MLILSLFACWDPPDSAPGYLDSSNPIVGDSGLACFGDTSSRATSKVTVLNWTVDGAGTVPTVVFFCLSDEGHEAEITLDVDGETGSFAFTAPSSGSWSLPDDEVITLARSGDAYWASDDVYSGALTAGTTGSAQVEATNVDGQVELELSWEL